MYLECVHYCLRLSPLSCGERAATSKLFLGRPSIFRMTMNRIAFLFLVVVGVSEALTGAEIAKFYADSNYDVSSGTNGGGIMNPSLSVTSSTSTITISANHVPPHATASSYTDPITTYISDTSNTYTIPLDPAIASSTSCLPAGTLGVAVNGVAIFSAYSRPCTDAIADEAIGFDECDGHPQEQGTYHYHYKADCLVTADGDLVTNGATEEQLYGVAFDGFPIYNNIDADGETVSCSQLDECHGYNPGTGYRYIVNDAFPYVIGCFKGTPIENIQCHCSDSEEQCTDFAINSGPTVLPALAVLVSFLMLFFN